jgi:integrase
MKGHIRERSPGHWAIVLDVRDAATGRRKRRWHSFKGTKREAQTKCAQLITEAEGGAAINPSRITVTEFLDRFERDWLTVHVTARSRERYQYALKHVHRHLGARPLQKICPADLAAFYAGLLQGGLASNTIKLIHRVLHRALGQAKVWGIIRDNPAELVKPPRPPDQEAEMLQPDQAARLLDRLRGSRPPLYLLASLALGTGARRNELLALRWCDLDLAAARLTIEQALEQTTAHGIRVKGPKTRHGRRTISLPPHLVDELRQHWRDQQKRRLAAGLGRIPDNAPVFARAAGGGYMNQQTVTSQWSDQMAAIGMSGVTLHSLRHTHASMLIAAGVDVVAVSRRLGHASPRITLQTYAHMIAGGDDKAAQIVGAAFGSKAVADDMRKPGKIGLTR